MTPILSHTNFRPSACGWEVDKARDIATCETILARFERCFPQGSLAALNREHSDFKLSSRS